MRILATLLAPDTGQARVSGVDVQQDPNTVRSLIGLAGQYAAVDETLTRPGETWSWASNVIALRQRTFFPPPVAVLVARPACSGLTVPGRWQVFRSPTTKSSPR
jgi:hypothetical protein